MHGVSGEVTASVPAAEGSKARWWVLAVLTLIYAVNFLDRTIIGVLAQPIKGDLALSDFQLGLLGGLAFALTYTLIGIPVARLSERVNRVKLIATATIVWSVMTMLCGVAANFLQLLLARAGVGVGEAGCTPPAHSIISDSFPARSRALALSLFQLGAVLGMVSGAVIGGFVAHQYGWRIALVTAGAPGLLLAALLWFTVRDPQRGKYDAPQATGEIPRFGQVLRHFLLSPTGCNVLLGGTFAVFVAYGVNHFTPALLARKFALDTGAAGAAFAVIVGGSAIGVLMGGALADRLSQRDRRWITRIPALALGLGAPLQILGYNQASLAASLLFLALGNAVTNAYIGPQFATIHNIMTPRMRATAMSVVLLAHSLIGLGLGAPFAGAVSDHMAASAFGGDYAHLCTAAPGGAALMQRCTDASATGLAGALSILSALYIIAALLFALASRSVREELVDRPG